MAAGDPGSPARYYSSTAVETSLQSSIAAQSQGASNTSFIVASISGFPTSYPYTLIVDPDTSKEEVVTVTSGSSTTLTVTRGSDNTQAVAHSAGAVVRHGVSGRDFRESENHIAARGYDIDQAILSAANQTHVHGIATGDGVVVGTTKAQTLTNKVYSSGTVTGAFTATSATFTGGTFTSATVTSSTVTSSTIVSSTLTGSFTASGATFTSPTISGSPVITGLSSAGMVDSSATPKNYVDSILGSATAAATSAASAAASATAAATSATSAANSATASAASASASASSASAAATSATSAAASATAAATSATSAAASATAAATSATSAAASATTAAASVATIAGYATDAANSASAAATSATSAANNATAAATSATSAANSATAAATSATSAANSATAAATSAASAATSASAAATSETNASNSASAAATSATSAAASATAAATSATSAASSATSAEAAWDSFDDRYLGPKSSPPTVDNDGNPLTAGVIYYNTTDGNMYVWNSGTSSWQVFTTTGDITAVVAGTGLSGGGTSGSVTLDLANTAVTAGSYTYTSLTVDAQGRLTAASSGTAPVTSVTAGSGISVTGTTTPTVAVDSTVLRTTGGQVISANTSANALEIRQIGTGNALYIEDSTNPDATPFAVTTDGLIWIGNQTDVAGVTERGVVVTDENTTGAVFVGRKSSTNTFTNASLILAKSGGTAASPTAVVNNEYTGSIVFSGFDGTNYSPGAQILGGVNGTPGVGDMPGMLIFLTSADGTASPTERMRIDASGNVGIGTTPLTNTTASFYVNNDQVFAGANKALMGNLYYSSGWKYIGNGRGGYVKFGDTASNVIELGYAPNNTGGAGANVTTIDSAILVSDTGKTTIKSIEDATTTTAANGGGFMGIPQNSTTTGSYTIVAGDAGKHIYSTATRTVTIPANGSVAFPVGTVLTFISGVGATTTIAITTDTMYLAGSGTTGSRTLAAHGMATAVKVASTTWYISGNGLT